jgi:hypothetical protein
MKDNQSRDREEEIIIKMGRLLQKIESLNDQPLANPLEKNDLFNFDEVNLE